MLYLGITKDQVAHVADLSRLSYDDQELEKMGIELSKILEYVNKLAELHTDNVQPTAHALAVTNVMREDEVRESLPVSDSLLNAPDREGDYFRVPRILDVGDEA